jgi:UDPglucose 6-dehydrogenase
VRITMIGGGYVGLVSGACFAEFGTAVIVVEADAGRRLVRGIVRAI